MKRFTLTDEAREDLREIKTYSLRQFGAVVTRDYLSGMRNTMQHLADMPGIGTDEAEELWQSCWSFPYLSHTIYYMAKNGGILVIGVVHQSRLPKRLLDRRKSRA